MKTKGIEREGKRVILKAKLIALYLRTVTIESIKARLSQLHTNSSQSNETEISAVEEGPFFPFAE